MFWQLCLENDKQSQSAPSTQYHQYDKHSICTQGQIKKINSKHGDNFIIFIMANYCFLSWFFFSHVSNEEKLKVTIKQKKDVDLLIQALLL